jgi:hypothetical protein
VSRYSAGEGRNFLQKVAQHIKYKNPRVAILGSEDPNKVRIVFANKEIQVKHGSINEALSAVTVIATVDISLMPGYRYLTSADSVAQAIVPLVSAMVSDPLN